MPCRLSSDADVPTAWYGTSHVGQMKRAYREGLRNRYGALMQAISGVHFNYSFPMHFWEVYADVQQQRADTQEFRSACYFDVLRNFRRLGWMVLYLFGTSPAVGRDFLQGACSALGYGALISTIGETLEFRPYGCCTVLFVTPEY